MRDVTHIFTLLFGVSFTSFLRTVCLYSFLSMTAQPKIDFKQMHDTLRAKMFCNAHVDISTTKRVTDAMEAVAELPRATLFSGGLWENAPRGKRFLAFRTERHWWCRYTVDLLLHKPVGVTQYKANPGSCKC